MYFRPLVKRQHSTEIKKGVITWVKAPDVKKRVVFLIRNLELDWIQTARIFCYRSTKAKTRAIARIWGLSFLWQRTLQVKPAYIIEVISEHFDKLPDIKKDEVLIHELSHIPKNFSGATVPHFTRGKRRFADIVNRLKWSYNQKVNL